MCEFDQHGGTALTVVTQPTFTMIAIGSFLNLGDKILSPSRIKLFDLLIPGERNVKQKESNHTELSMSIKANDTVDFTVDSFIRFSLMSFYCKSTLFDCGSIRIFYPCYNDNKTPYYFITATKFVMI